MGNKFFPVSIDLNNKNILVVGAGKIAVRKIETLMKYNCNIKVITKEIADKKINGLLADKKIKLEKGKEFSEKDLENIFLVIASTSDEKVNKYIANLCLSKNILVNNITSKDDMSLRFSSVYETDEFQISVSARGNPKKSKEIKNVIKEFLKNNKLNLKE